MKKNSIKNRRINDEVRVTLSQILRDVKDPRISGLLSILMVEVAPDLKTCKVWVSVYGSLQEGKQTMQGLRSAQGFIRSELARRLNLRNTPQLQFILDNSIEYGVEMSHRIDEVTALDEEAERERLRKGIDISDTSAYVLKEEDKDLF